MAEDIDEHRREEARLRAVISGYEQRERAFKREIETLKTDLAAAKKEAEDNAEEVGYYRGLTGGGI
jgi:chromosome segregation ATPase